MGPNAYRNIAQSVEQRADNAEVDGPNPSIPTIILSSSSTVLRVRLISVYTEFDSLGLDQLVWR